MPANFPKFMQLPPEIRTMVWEYALPDRRVYEIMDVPGAKQKMKPVDGLMFANVHHEPPPALAAVCIESRIFVSKHYKPLQLGKTTKYVDLSRDLLLLEPYLLLKRLHRTLHFMSRIPLIRTRMAGLAMGTSYGVYTGICHPVLNWKANKSNMGKLMTGLAKFPKLKTLLFVVHQEFQFEFDYRSPPPASLLPAVSGDISPRPPPSLSVFMNHPAWQTEAMTHGNPPDANADYYTPPPQTATEPRQQIVHQAYRFKFDVEDSINNKPRRPQLNDLLFYPIEDPKATEDRDDWEALLNNSNTTSATTGYESMDALMEDAETGEWTDPWPTNDDWRRFRRRFQRAVVATLQSGLVHGGDGKNALCVHDEPSSAVPIAIGPGGVSAKNGAAATGSKKYQYQHYLQMQRREASSTDSDNYHPGFNNLHNILRRQASGEIGGLIKHSAGTSFDPRRRYSLKQNIPAIKGVSLLWRYTRGQ